ncbi:hypothetical protein C8A01DRAFT_46713 [Parachaetomium inaequale]|uniref:Protein kinase domain-containing protein n=1 Tax=Parachaetomium inaequale TaxID=2588326 RepID=A0AAN6PF94_9PEZI|nr:hypothetical protein C8A01DRAFT_46713 [Parachaetomium inaequale]
MSSHSEKALFHPGLKYSHQTLVFYPLRVPEIPERQHLVDDKENESSQYLQARPKGFIFLHWYQNDTHPLSCAKARVGLFASVDRPQELVVIKKLPQIPYRKQAADEDLPMPPEIEQCTLSTQDPAVRRQLPLYHKNMGLTPFPQLHAFQVHKRVLGRLAGNYDARDDVTVIYKWYNGGTLYDFIISHHKAGRQVPEGFIWHVLAEIGRAISWLHTGHIPSRNYNVDHQNEVGQPGSTVDQASSVPGWQPICHQDLHSCNIFLHYPTDEERKADPRLNRFTDSLPQIIVGDFGLSFQHRYDRAKFLCDMGKRRGMPEPSTWLDKANIGGTLLRLVNPHYDPRESDISLFSRWDEHLLDPVYQYSTPDVWMNKYSQDIVACWQKFKTLAPMAEFIWNWENALESSTAENWETFPSNNFVFGTMIAMADRYLDSYVHSGKQESVRWTQPSNAYMPYHSMLREPKHHRRDWAKVKGELKRETKVRFSNFRRRCVRIRQAHIVGAGTPERELDQVRPKYPKKIPAPDDLPDYSDVEAGARRATVRPVRPDWVRNASPPIPEEIRRREQYMDDWYERKCRELGLF